MSTFTASQTVPAPSQAAGLSAPARFTAAHALPAPAQRARVRNPPLYGPAEPRPPGVPAVPRPLWPADGRVGAELEDAPHRV